MSDLFKTVFPFFGRAENYSQMLTKLASSVFWQCVIGLYILKKSPDFSAFLNDLPTNKIPQEALPDSLEWLDPTIIVVSLIVAAITHAVQLHNQLQKPLGIRSWFDREKIFLPLSKLVNKATSKKKLDTFKTKRAQVMQDVFYKYASSTRESGVVDKHNVIQALWLWTYFWALLEAVVIFLSFSTLFLVFDLYNNAILYLALAICCLPLMAALLPRLNRAALAQIQQIAADKNAKASVRKAISAL